MLEPAVAVTSPFKQLFITPGVSATTRPEGSGSEKETIVNSEAFPFDTVKVRVVVPLTAMFAAPKALAIEAG